MNRKIVSLALAGSMVLGSMSSAFAADISDFKDIPKDWSRTAIEAAIQNGLLNGSSGEINASGTLTRAQMAAIVSRVFGATEQADLSKFVDISKNDWYYADMAKAVAMGVFQGSGNRLNPEAAITRQEAFAVLSRAFLLNGGVASSLTQFSDDELVAAWARETVAAMVSEGYVNGANGKLNPTGTITRAEFAQIMYNMVKHYDSIDKTVEGNVVLRSDSQIAAGTVIKGDLIIGDGVTLSEVKLDCVTVEGRIVIRGGDTVTLSNGAKAASIAVAADSTAIKVESGAAVSEITVKSGADNVSISGTGTVGKVTAEKGSTGTKVTTPDTKITAETGAGAVSTGKGTVEAGKTGTTDKNGNITSGTTTGGGSSSGGGSSGGGSSSGGETVSTADSIYNGEVVAPIVMDAAYANSDADKFASRTYGQIKRAVGDLRQDIAMVTGAIDYKEVQQIFVDDEEKQASRLAAAEQNKIPQMVTDTANVQADYAIIVGSINDSPMIQKLIADGKFDEAKTIQGNWEAYAIKEIDNPIDGVKKALVIAGSDARGTIYGIYSISEEIGVSPYYWYSDVPVDVKDKIDVDYATALVDDGPDVKYRGIFINDEDDSIRYWAAKKFPTANGTPDVNYYRHVFEMQLRLKSNFIWPAMHERSTAFNIATEEDGTTPINSKEAAKYGIVVGSTHCDILLRTNTGEWKKWSEANKQKYNIQGDNYKANYDFTLNREAVLQYWRERLETNKDFESILTLGIRGVHDGAFNCANLNDYPGSTKEEKQVAFMADVIAAQRALIEEVYGVPADQVPQVLIPYKEMGDVYNAGLNKIMAEKYPDVTLMWAEDNYGYVRQTPNETEKQRSGGAGVYYHASYYGSPTCYLWLNSIQLSTMSEQMHRAYDEGMRNQWILNVGDIKPGDQSTEFFMKMAWDTDAYNDKTIVSKYLTEQAMRDYNLSATDARTVAEAMNEYYQMVGTKRPEFYTTATHSFDMSAYSNGDEALLWQQRSQAVVDKLTPIYNKLNAEEKASFYQQLYYHALSANDAATEYAYYWKAMLAAEQGRVNSTNVYVQLSKQARDRIKSRTADFNNLNNGKWNNYIFWTHVESNGKEDYSHDIIRDSEYPEVPAESTGAGAAAEGSKTAGSGELRLDAQVKNDTRYFDVFSKQNSNAEWVAEAPKWLILSQTSGTTASEQRVTVTADWDQISGTETGEIKVYNAVNGVKSGDPVATFTVNAVNDTMDYAGKQGFIEADGYIAIEAEHYSEMVSGSDGSSWQVVQSNGQHGDTMKAYPNNTASTASDGAKLVYNVYAKNAGTFDGVLYREPTLNEGSEADGTARSCNVQISANGSGEQTLVGNRTYINDGGYNKPKNAWSQNVMRMYEPLSFSVTLHEGWNTIELTRLDPSVVVDRMVIRTNATADQVFSLLGPVESPNNIASGSAVQNVKVAALPEDMADVDIHANLTLTTADSQTEYTDAQNIQSAESGDERIVTVEVQDGKIMVTPHHAGITQITAKDENGKTFSFTVTVNPAQGSGVYLEENGKVVIDAADALENSGEAFATNASKVWKLKNIGIQAQPDTGANWIDTKNLTNAPSVTYKVNIANAGNYYLYVNTSNPNADADSYHVAVDGDYSFTDKSEMTGRETWYSAGKALNLDAGEHTITVYAREDGFTLNQLVLSTNKSEKLSGLQAASERGTPVPTITMNTFGNLSMRVDEAAQEVSVTASASNNEAVTITASSDSEAVSVSAVENGKFTVTPVSVGTANITVTASADGCKTVTRAFRVTVSAASNPDDENKAYGETDGKIVINAVDAMQDTAYASHTDYSEKYTGTSFAWTKVENEESIQLTPVPANAANLQDGVSKWAWTDFNALTDKVPSLTFKLNVDTAGDYFFSFFSNTPNNSADSFHIVVNGDYQYQTGDKNNGVGDTVGENWFYCKKTVHLNEGKNTLTIYGRESGVLLRQLVLSTGKQTSLSGWQTSTLN